MCIMENVYWETIKLFEIEIENNTENTQAPHYLDFVKVTTNHPRSLITKKYVESVSASWPRQESFLPPASDEYLSHHGISVL